MAITLYGRTTTLNGPIQDWRRIIGAIDDDNGQSQFRTALIRRIAKELSRDLVGTMTINVECDDGDVSVVEEAARSINIDVDAQWPKAGR